ncbi:MAG: hypothetical protein M1835_002933 [Candelina submexicana]|nr:MAG: hypothetical protein M1835_002933 [Candelina submexicana]
MSLRHSLVPLLCLLTIDPRHITKTDPNPYPQIFWFSAFISVATWTNTGIRHGASKKKVKEGDGNCSTFDFGSESKSELINPHVFAKNSLLFALTSSISIHNLLQYRKTGTLPIHAHPHPTSSSSSDPNSLEAATKDAFSTHAHDDDDHEIDLHRPHDQDDEYALLHSTTNTNNNNNHHLSDEGIYHAGRPMSWGADMSYVGAGWRGEHESSYGEGGGGGRPLPTTPGFRGDPFGDHHADTGYGDGDGKGGGGGGKFGRAEDLGYRGGGGVRYD